MSGIDVSIKVEGLKKIHFEKRELKAAIRKGGSEVRREARRLIASRAISSAGGFPGKDTGAMARSIKVTVGSGGGYAKVMPYMTEEMRRNTTSKKDKKPDFYPAYLVYGTKRGLKPRKDFMGAALFNRRSFVRSAINAALKKALVEG